MQEVDALRQFRWAILCLAALIVLGTAGYHWLEEWTVLDALYMTVITLGTVGFKEVHNLDPVGKMFTIVLIVFGVSMVFWAGTSLVEAVVSEQIWHVLQRRHMQRYISKLHDHFIVCGYGRMGQQIVKDLQREGADHVVIERNPEQLPKLIAQDIPFVEGNASDDKILIAAGVKNAKGLITVAPTDEENVFITLSARALNPKLFIVARSILEDNESKLRMAGANRVMSPYVMGGRRMATAVIRPNVLDFLELAMHTDEVQIMIEEIAVEEDSCFVGLSLMQSHLRNRTGVTVIGIKRPNNKIVANPGADEVLRAGDVLIVLGTRQQLDNAEQLTCEIPVI